MQTFLTAFLGIIQFLSSAFASSDDGLPVSSFLTLELKKVKWFPWQQFINKRLTYSFNCMGPFSFTWNFSEVELLKYLSNLYPEKNKSGDLSQWHYSSSEVNLCYRTIYVSDCGISSTAFQVVNFWLSALTKIVMFKPSQNKKSSYQPKMRNFFLELFSFVLRISNLLFWNESCSETRDFFWYEST